MDRHRRARSSVEADLDSELPAVVAYTRTTTDQRAASRQVAQMIDATVLSLRPPARRETGARRAVRCERRARQSSQEDLRV